MKPCFQSGRGLPQSKTGRKSVAQLRVRGLHVAPLLGPPILLVSTATVYGLVTFRFSNAWEEP